MSHALCIAVPLPGDDSVTPHPLPLSPPFIGEKRLPNEVGDLKV